MINWQCRTFSDFSAQDLYEILQLRMEVFVVEQNCFYQDLDGKDQIALHLLGRSSESSSTDNTGNPLDAYLRVLPPGLSYDEPSIGRVLTSPRARGAGLGKALMLEGIRQCESLYPNQGIRISGQLYLQKFYEDLGFKVVSDVYDDAGIPHIEMLRSNK